MDDTYEDREHEFGRDYEDFEPAEIVKLAARTGEWLDLLLMEPEAVNEAMTLLHRRVIHTSNPELEGASWREIWEDTSINEAMNPKGAGFAVGLNAFAFYGLLPDIPDALPAGVPDDNLAIVEACVSHGRRLLDAIPPGWGEMSELPRTVLAAEARLRIDTDRDVSPEQLASLARISLKSVKNLLTPKAGGGDLRLNPVGAIDASDAARWLAGRPDFKSSLWQRARGRSTSVRAPEPEEVGEVLFVPVAKDGTWFDPVACRQERGYVIGPKGNEETVKDYRVALDHLARMRTPYWRRPGPQGGWGLVAGQGWQRKIVRELALQEEGSQCRPS